MLLVFLLPVLLLFSFVGVADRGGGCVVGVVDVDIGVDVGGGIIGVVVLVDIVGVVARGAAGDVVGGDVWMPVGLVLGWSWLLLVLLLLLSFMAFVYAVMVLLVLLAMLLRGNRLRAWVRRFF